MKLSFKSIALLIGVVFFHNFSVAQLGTLNSSTNPYIFIDLNAQKMVHVISTNQDLFSSDPELFKEKINKSTRIKFEQKRKKEISVSYASINKMKKILKWKPKYNKIDYILESSIKWEKIIY